MRVVVVREYTDKYTGEGHVIGEKLELSYYGSVKAEDCRNSGQRNVCG